MMPVKFEALEMMQSLMKTEPGEEPSTLSYPQQGYVSTFERRQVAEIKEGNKSISGGSSSTSSGMQSTAALAAPAGQSPVLAPSNGKGGGNGRKRKLSDTTTAIHEFHKCPKSGCAVWLEGGGGSECTGCIQKHTHPAQALPPHEPAAHLTPVVLSSAAPVSVKEEGASPTLRQIVKMEDMANSSVLMGGAGFAYIMRTGTATPGGSDMAGSLDETFDMPAYVPTLLPPRREDVPASQREIQTKGRTQRAEGWAAREFQVQRQAPTKLLAPIASGFYGVSARRKRWQAHIYYDSKNHSLGCFDTKQ